MGDTFQLRVIRKSAFTASAVSTTVTVGQFFQDKLSNGVSRAYNLPSQPMEITLMYKVGIGKDIVTKVNIDPRGYEVVEVVFSYKMTAAGFVPFLMFFQPTARIEANVNYYRNAADPYPVNQQPQPSVPQPPVVQPRPQPVTQPQPQPPAGQSVKFCPHCGFRLPADAKFCSKCGKPQPRI